MGTEITLDIGGVAIDWSKNGIGDHHGPLFQEQDRKRLRCKQIDYAYFEELGEEPADDEMSFSRPLRAVLPRLEILGLGLQAVRGMYDAAAAEWRGTAQAPVDADIGNHSRQPPEPLSFDEFLAFVCAHPMPPLDTQEHWGLDDASERRIRGRFDGSVTVAKIPFDSYRKNDACSERGCFVAITGFLGAHATLRLLAECPANLDLDVTWQYGPLVTSGWVAPEAFTAGPGRRQTTLVATEGSSDVHILTHALKLLRPDVADFFRFIDPRERHPFSGTGSLKNFAEGLAKIDVHNQVVFVFDNDAEGVEAAAYARGLKLPPNMGVLVLPDLEAFQQFPARGPNGVINSDINGRAAAIECYLDLRLPKYPPAQVQWTNYKRDLDVYQGALKHKESYIDAFLKQTAQSLRDSGYDTSKIERMLDTLIKECGRLAIAATAP